MVGLDGRMEQEIAITAIIFCGIGAKNGKNVTSISSHITNSNKFHTAAIIP